MRAKERYPLHLLDTTSMSPAEWGAYKALVIRRARAEQAVVIHKFAARLAGAVLRVVCAISASRRKCRMPS